MKQKPIKTPDVQPECANCRYFRPAPVLIIGEARGQCALPPPPIVAQLYAMLAEEPNMRLDYARVFNHTLPDAIRHGACSGHKPVVQQ